MALSCFYCDYVFYDVLNLIDVAIFGLMGRISGIRF